MAPSAILNSANGIAAPHPSASPSSPTPSSSSPSSPSSPSSTPLPPLPPLQPLQPFTPIKNICVVGAGYVGGPTASVIAFTNPDITVTVADRDPVRIRRWNSAHPPIYEPGLHDIVRVARDGSRAFNFANCVLLPSSAGGDNNNDNNDNDDQSKDAVVDTCSLSARKPNLFFTTHVADAVAAADVVMIAVNTPTKYSGNGAGQATDLTAFEAVLGVVAQNARPGAIVVEKSTVPVRTAVLIHETLAMLRPGVDFEVISNPEFLSAGTAVADLLYPDRILIGSDQTASGVAAAEAVAAIYTSWIPRARIITTNVWSSELAKLVANSMLAQRISSINSIAAVCDETDADVDEVARAIGVDPRIGDKFLRAGIGFGGSCFKKDILNLVYIADSHGLYQVGEYWRQVVKMNDYARDRFSKRIIASLYNTLELKKITILGYAFKKNTSDTREAPALEMIRTFLAEKPREIAIFDPCCNQLVIEAEVAAMVKSLGLIDNVVVVYRNAYDACAGSNVIVIATEFDEFSNIKKPAPPTISATTVTATAATAATASATASATITTTTTIPVAAVAPGKKPNPNHDPRPLGCPGRAPMPVEILALHKFLVQSASGGGVSEQIDPLNRFHPEPACADDCPDCGLEAVARESGLSTAAPGMGNKADYKPKERLDWGRISEGMSKPKWLFDGRGIIDAKEMLELGIRFVSVGRQMKY